LNNSSQSNEHNEDTFGRRSQNYPKIIIDEGDTNDPAFKTPKLNNSLVFNEKDKRDRLSSSFKKKNEKRKADISP
jgi:hypothetical protein